VREGALTTMRRAAQRGAIRGCTVPAYRKFESISLALADAAAD
jgi:hypothetical protein